MNHFSHTLVALTVTGVACFGCASAEPEGVESSASTQADKEVADRGAADQGASEDVGASVNTLTGNGAPSGPHYNLNLIGVSNPKTTDMTDSSRHSIFVPLNGSTKINLAEGDFAVLDGNGTDGSASFQLPNPDPTNSGTTTYSVWARALGKPGGKASMQTCATDVATGELYCSVYATVQTRTKGKQQFTDVSRDLLYIYADLDGDGKTERYPLFSDALQDYFWQYSNQNLKVLQLRFYAVASTVP